MMQVIPSGMSETLDSSKNLRNLRCRMVDVCETMRRDTLQRLPGPYQNPSEIEGSLTDGSPIRLESIRRRSCKSLRSATPRIEVAE
jgi:hypothetical protein